MNRPGSVRWCCRTNAPASLPTARRSASRIGRTFTTVLLRAAVGRVQRAAIASVANPVPVGVRLDPVVDRPDRVENGGTVVLPVRDAVAVQISGLRTTGVHRGAVERAPALGFAARLVVRGAARKQRVHRGPHAAGERGEGLSDFALEADLLR